MAASKIFGGYDTAIIGKIVHVSAVRGVSALCAFLLTFLLIRLGSSELLGSFAFALVTIQLVSALCLAGIDTVLLRLILRYEVKSRGNRQKLFHEALALGAMTSLAGIALTCLGGLLLPSIKPHLAAAGSNLTVMSPIVMCWVLSKICAAFLRGRKRIALSQVVDNALPPLLSVLILGIGYAAGVHVIAHIAAIYLACSVLSAALGLWLTSISLSHFANALMRHTRSRNFRIVRKGAQIQVANITNYAADWLATGALTFFAPLSAVAIYRVTSQFSQAFMLVLSSIEVPVVNVIAEHHVRQDYRTARKVIRTSQYGLLLLSALPLTLILVEARPIMADIFHQYSSEAALCLQIVLLGQFVNMATGPVGGALVVLGQGTALVRVSLTSFAITAVSILILMPKWGVVGACFSAALGVASRNILNFRAVKETVGRAERKSGVMPPDRAGGERSKIDIAKERAAL